MTSIMTIMKCRLFSIVDKSLSKIIFAVPEKIRICNETPILAIPWEYNS